MGCWDFGLVWFCLFEVVGFGGRVILAVLLGGKRTDEMFEVDGLGRQGKTDGGCNSKECEDLTKPWKVVLWSEGMKNMDLSSHRFCKWTVTS